uniref:Aldehyde dehydrogenase domain-containing protein n=1 Tax=Eutreptiella gymnastica TaxID=73025 RepID=A0A7S1ILB0_9EUGL
MPSGMATIVVDAGGRSVALNAGLFIDGAFVPSCSGKSFATVSPVNGKTIAQVAEGDKPDVDKAVDAAHRAFGGWSMLDTSVRAEHLRKLAAAIEARIDDFVHLEALDNGKTLEAARTVDLNFAVQTFYYYAGWADKLMGETLQTSEDHFDYTLREPLGVCAGIIPWNYPLLTLAWKVAPALACGNTFILKSSEKTPLSALLFAQLCAETGLPKGVFNLVSGFGPTVGAALARHPGVHKVAFTGSTATGRLIQTMAADTNLKKVTLELGGKSPTIIFGDADLEEAVAWAAIGVFANHGQVCCAGTRIFVHSDVYDEFAKRFVKAAQDLRVGDPFGQVDQGPQVDTQQMDKVLGYIETGKKEGARLLTGGHRVGSEGCFVAPSVFADVRDDHTIAREEIFGPVACLFRFDNEEDVIRRANDTPYGLAAAVFTTDLAKALRVTRKLQAGVVWVNEYNMTDWRMPFGGYKESGYGRDLGKYALEGYTQCKAVRIRLSKL